MSEMQHRIGGKVVQDYLATLGEFKSPGPDELHSRILKKLAEVTSEPPHSLI